MGIFLKLIAKLTFFYTYLVYKFTYIFDKINAARTLRSYRHQPAQAFDDTKYFRETARAAIM